LAKTLGLKKAKANGLKAFTWKNIISLLAFIVFFLVVT